MLTCRQTYLSDYDDDGAYGHISLGRSFALDMGSVIPRTDQKLSEPTKTVPSSL